MGTSNCTASQLVTCHELEKVNFNFCEIKYLCKMAQGKNFGTCKWWNSQKGFGFITPDDGGADVFVHQTAISADGFRSLAEGEELEYTVEQGADGRLKASNVSGPNGKSVKGAPQEFRSGGRGGGMGGGRGGGRGGGGGYGGYGGGQGGYGGGSYGGGQQGGYGGGQGGYGGGGRGGGYGGGDGGAGGYGGGQGGYGGGQGGYGGGGAQGYY